LIRRTDTFIHSLLQDIACKNDVVVFGKHIVTKRKTSWYGDSNYRYIYSNITDQALSWTRKLVNLKQIVENPSNTKFILDD